MAHSNGYYDIYSIITSKYCDSESYFMLTLVCRCPNKLLQFIRIVDFMLVLKFKYTIQSDLNLVRHVGRTTSLIIQVLMQNIRVRTVS